MGMLRSEEKLQKPEELVTASRVYPSLSPELIKALVLVALPEYTRNV